MRSIPLTLTWQFWRRGAGIAAAMAMGYVAFLMLLYGVLSLAGLKSFGGEVGQHLHFSLSMMSMICCLAIAGHVHPTLVRNFTLPLRAATLVAWPMLHGMLASSATYIFSASVLNFVYDTNWPVFGPALFMAVVAAGGQAIMWGLRSSPFCQVVSAALAFAVVVLWFFEMYGVDPNFRSEPTGATVADLMVMVAAIAAAFCVCVWGVSRDRCGEGPNLKPIGDWLEDQFDRLFRHSENFGTRTRALFLFEWKLKGLIFPLVATVVASVVIFWCFFWRADATQAVEACAGLSGMAMMVAFGMGAIMGMDYKGNGLAMDSFKATRPATDTELAYGVLKATAASTLAGWAIWVATMAIIAASFHAVGRGEELAIALQSLSVNFRPWPLPIYFFGAVLASWAIAATTASACLSRMWLVLGIIYFFSIAVFIFTFGLQFVVSEKVHEIVWMGFLLVLAIGATGGTMAAFASCIRWRMLDSRIVGFAALGGAMLVALSCSLLDSQDLLTPLSVSYAVGAICLPFAPLATAPLAVYWNRHR